MTRYLLDTNHASPLVTLAHPLRERVLFSLNAGNQFAVCVPVVAETLFGLGMLPRAKRSRSEWKQLEFSISCYVPDANDAEAAADLQIALRRQGWQLATVDALIAALALRYDLVLLTTDRDFEAVLGLRHENWIR